MSIIDRLIGRIAPHDCLHCGKEGNLLCLTCLRRLPPTGVRYQGFENLERVQAVTPYEGLAKALIWQLKSAGAQSAATIMASQMKKLVTYRPQVIIVPIPTASGRIRRRGYNQAKLLARALGRQTGLPYQDCLTRYGQAHQVGAARKERLHQLDGVLRARKQYMVKDAHIILVDDVVTTGATLEAAAAVLKVAGATRIEAITFAQA